jgi:phenylacetate-CoA ligase
MLGTLVKRFIGVFARMERLTTPFRVVQHLHHLFRVAYYLHQLRGNLWLKPSVLRKMQNERLRAIVKHAYDNVPFYHRKFEEAGIKPDDIKTVEDLNKIPLTTKLEIQSKSFQEIIAMNVNPKNLVKNTTSGSTGIPLTTFSDRRVEDFYEAVWLRAMFEDGLRLGDKMAVIADPRLFPKKKSLFQRLGFERRKYISIFDSAERQMALLRKFKPDVVRGYASSLFILATEFGEALRELKTRLIFNGAEPLDASSRKIISSAFGGELFDFYACNEFGLLAWECKAHDLRHLNADTTLVEFLDDEGEAVSPGKRGRVVCTGLFNYVMPLIRYELGDVAVPVDDECSCGITLPSIKRVEGRTDDFLVATDGRIISPTVFFPYPFENVDWIRQFRVIQESRKKLVIQVAVKETLADQDIVVKNAESKIRRLFGEDMEVKFEFVDEIPRDPSGKLRKVISRVNRTTES